MKNVKFMSALAACTFVLTGLTSCRTSLNVRDYRALQPQEARVLTHMATADLDVAKTRVTKTYTYDRKQMKCFGMRPVINNASAVTSRLRRDVCARACQETGCDVWVGAIYTVDSKNVKKEITVTVSGYPAHYKNWGNANLSDSLLYHEMRTRHNTHKIERSTATRTKLF